MLAHLEKLRRVVADQNHSQSQSQSQSQSGLSVLADSGVSTHWQSQQTQRPLDMQTVSRVEIARELVPRLLSVASQTASAPIPVSVSRDCQTSPCSPTRSASQPDLETVLSRIEQKVDNLALRRLTPAMTAVPTPPGEASVYQSLLKRRG